MSLHESEVVEEHAMGRDLGGSASQMYSHTWGRLGSRCNINFIITIIIQFLKHSVSEGSHSGSTADFDLDI